MFDVQFCFQTHANEILYSNFAPIRGIHRLLKRSKEFWKEVNLYAPDFNNISFCAYAFFGQLN